MKRILLFTVASIFRLVFFSSSALADSELKFFGVATDGNMLKLDVFTSNLGVRLDLNDHQRDQIRDILSDCHDRVVVIRQEVHSPRDFDRLVRGRYVDADKRILTVLTPVQLKQYRHWRGDVHHWIHEQKEWREDERHDAKVVRADDRREDHREHIEEHDAHANR